MLHIILKLTKFTKTNHSSIRDKRFDFQKAEKNGIVTDATIIVDKKTGANYLFVRSGYGAGLTPLIDADGKPTVTKQFHIV